MIHYGIMYFKMLFDMLGALGELVTRCELSVQFLNSKPLDLYNTELFEHSPHITESHKPHTHFNP